MEAVCCVVFVCRLFGNRVTDHNATDWDFHKKDLCETLLIKFIVNVVENLVHQGGKLKEWIRYKRKGVCLVFMTALLCLDIFVVVAEAEMKNWSRLAC